MNKNPTASLIGPRPPGGHVYAVGKCRSIFSGVTPVVRYYRLRTGMAINGGKLVDIPFPELHMLEEIMNREYRLEVVPDPEGGFTIFYPDLPGCVTDIESLDELPLAAQEVRELWIASAIEDGQPIPMPSDPRGS